MGQRERVELSTRCDRCCALQEGVEESLLEFAHIEDRSREALRRMAQYHEGYFFRKVRDRSRRRGEEKQQMLRSNLRDLKDLRERLANGLMTDLMAGGDVSGLVEGFLRNGELGELHEKVAVGDLSHHTVEDADVGAVLNEYASRGLLEKKGPAFAITPAGSRRLARHILKKTLAALDSASPGVHRTRTEGFGVSESGTVRKYEFGDEFYRIHVEMTLLAAFERLGGRTGAGIPFDQADLRVRETDYESRFMSGLLIDESGSMRGDKLHAALDISLALSELVHRNRKDGLHICFFSDRTRDVPFWQIANPEFSGGITDMKRALTHMRLKMKRELGSKQVYLITDTEPNTENSLFVGFDSARRGVLEEARRYRAEGITLNVVMLEHSTHLRELALHLAKQNLGRAFFTTPGNLARTIVKDYMTVRSKGRRKGRA